MKKQYTCIACLGISLTLYGAASSEPGKEMAQFFEEAKLAIASGRQGALDGLTTKMVREHQEQVKQLLEYALRAKHENSGAYVDVLIDALQIRSERTLVPAERKRALSMRSSQSLPLLDVAIMTGNIANVKQLLKLKPDLTVCRLLAGGDRKPVSVEHALEELIKKKQNKVDDYGGQKVVATLAQLLEIRELIREHTAAKPSRLEQFKKMFIKK